jgi:hypothetical protein
MHLPTGAPSHLPERWRSFVRSQRIAEVGGIDENDEATSSASS